MERKRKASTTSSGPSPKILKTMFTGVDCYGPASSGSGTTNFLSLPRELRDLIYEALFESTAETLYVESFYHIATLGNVPDLALTGVNRQIRGEFLQTMTGKMLLLVDCAYDSRPNYEDYSQLNQTLLECVTCLSLHEDDYTSKLFENSLEFLKSEPAKHLRNVTSVHLSVFFGDTVDRRKPVKLCSFSIWKHSLDSLFRGLYRIGCGKTQPIEFTVQYDWENGKYDRDPPNFDPGQFIRITYASEVDFVAYI